MTIIMNILEALKKMCFNGVYLIYNRWSHNCIVLYTIQYNGVYLIYNRWSHNCIVLYTINTIQWCLFNL